MNHAKVSSLLLVIRIDITDDVDPTYSGQIFNSYEEAKEYYFLYAFKIGFLVPKGTTKVVDGWLVVRCFVCYMEGFSKSNGSKNHWQLIREHRINRDMRCGCATTIHIKRIFYSDHWIVRFVNDCHDHAMVTPSKHRYLRTNRIIPTCSRELFWSLEASNLPLNK